MIKVERTIAISRRIKIFLELDGYALTLPSSVEEGSLNLETSFRDELPYFAQRKPIVVARRSGSLKSRVSTVLLSEGPPTVLGAASSQPPPRTPRYRPVSGPFGF